MYESDKHGCWLSHPCEKYEFVSWDDFHLEKFMEFVNGKDGIPYMKWKINNVPNHQPAMYNKSSLWLFI